MKTSCFILFACALPLAGCGGSTSPAEQSSDRSAGGESVEATGASYDAEESEAAPSASDGWEEDSAADSAEYDDGAAPATQPSPAPAAERTVGGSTARTPQRMDVRTDDEYQELISTHQSLSSALSAAGSLDCDEARSMQERICDLADRICRIASSSGDHQTGQRCEDGRSRCERAGASIRDRC